MTAASRCSPSTSCRMIAASSIHGTGAQNLANAMRHGAVSVSGMAFGPDFSSRALASALVRPGNAPAFGSGWSGMGWSLL